MNHLMTSSKLRKIGYTPGDWIQLIESKGKYRTWTKQVTEDLVFQVDEEQHPTANGEFRSTFHFIAHESLHEEMEFKSALWLLNLESIIKNALP